ncbi:hypothetical protein [Helicobacter rodentium]|uniref:hypothetical protein n=1 Tax=Helicobacter rodentium TaxID=59617 RepID=UPI0023F29C19|nr:hypothetical protein [Helicobacter rodentium]
MNINTKTIFISSFTPNSKSCNSDFQQSLAQQYTKSNESTFLAQHKYSSGNCDDGSQYDWLYDSKMVQEKINKGELIKLEEYNYFISEQGVGVTLPEYYDNKPPKPFNLEKFESKIYVSTNPTNPSDYGYKTDEDNFFGSDFNQEIGLPDYIKITPFDLDALKTSPYDERIDYEPISKKDPMGYLKQAWNLFAQIVGEDFNPNGNGYITREQYMQLPKGIELKGNVYDGIATIYGDSASAKIGAQKDWNLAKESKSNGFMEIFSNDELQRNPEEKFISISALFSDFVLNGLRSFELGDFGFRKNRVEQVRDYHKNNQDEIAFVGENNLAKMKPIQKEKTKESVSGESLLISVLSEISKAKQNLLSNAYAKTEEIIHNSL